MVMARRPCYFYIVFFCLIALLFSLTTTAADIVYPHEAAKTALSNNPEIRQAYAIVEVSEQQVTIARSGYLPTVDVNLSRGYERTHTTTIQGETMFRKENGVRLVQTLFDGFGVLADVRGQQNLLNVAKYNVIEIENEIAFQALDAFIAVAQADEFVRLGQENVANHEDMLEKTTARFQAGAANRGDMSLVEGRLALAKSTLTQLKGDALVARASYLAVVGEMAPDHLSIVDTQYYRDVDTMHDAIVLALDNSPALFAASETVQASQQLVRQSKSVVYPQLSLELTAGQNDNLDGLQGNNNDRQALLLLSFNIFNGGADRAGIRESQARRVESVQVLEQIRRLVTERISQDWVRLQTARFQLEDLFAHVEASEAVVIAYENEFLLGQRQLFSILDQEIELFESKLNYVQGENETKRDLFRVLATAGVLVQEINAHWG